MPNTLAGLTVALVAPWLSLQPAHAHPASGIVLDEQGNIFFVYSGRGVMKIDTNGNLTNVHPTRGGHWLTLDADGRFSRFEMKFFERITADGIKPALIFADGGAPVAVNRDGNLYFGASPDTHEVTPGALAVARVSPDGTSALFAPAIGKTLHDLNDGITGLAAGSDGSLYIAGWNSLLEVNSDGVVTTVAHPVVVMDCDKDPADHNPANDVPLLRGLAVDSSGAVYVAATSCHALLKITPNGEVSTILKAERPWSPTGVALHNGSIYVLEYTNANGPAKESWSPRIRKVGPDGKVTVIAQP